MGCESSKNDYVSVAKYNRYENFEKNWVLSSKVLGQGSFGKVYQAQSKLDGTKAAVKVIIKSHLDTLTLADIKQEISFMQNLDHPNIVKYYETYEFCDQIFMVMELCPGGNLYQRVESQGMLLEPEARSIAHKIS